MRCVREIEDDGMRWGVSVLVLYTIHIIHIDVCVPRKKLPTDPDDNLYESGR